MSFASGFHMPGAYQFDPNAPSSQPLSAGIFRPPVSPSDSSYNLAKSTGSLYSDISMATTPIHNTAKRKRARTRESTPIDWNMSMDGADEEKMAASRQIRYALAGQINATPIGAPNGAEGGILDDSVYSDVDYRRALGPKRVCDGPNPSNLRFGQNNLPRQERQEQQDKPTTLTSSAWSTLAITIGDVMGKVWEFCKNGAFRGFHAGGGKGYELNGSTVIATENDRGSLWSPAEHGAQVLSPDDPPASTGQLPQSDYFPYTPEYLEMSTPDSTPRPAAKRRQVSTVKENEDLNRNWVMVEEPSPISAAPPPPRRSFGAELAAAKMNANSIPRPASALRTRQSGGYQSHTLASKNRRSLPAASRFTNGRTSPSTLPLPRGRTSLRISHAGSPALSAQEPASFAAPRPSTAGSFASAINSPSRPTFPTPSRIPVASQPTGASGLRNSIGHIHSNSTGSGNPFSLSTGSNASRPTSRQSQSSRLSFGGALKSPSSPTKSSSTSGPYRRPGSSASVARRGSIKAIADVQEIKASPRLDDEAKKLAKKKIVAEMDADAKVDAFNARLLSMIRQGKEALGTRVEVEEYSDGPGGGGRGAETWVDDDEIM